MSTATVDVGPVSTAGAVAEVTRQIDDARANDHDATVLDFTHLSARGRRITPQWGAVLANVLAGRYRELRFAVDLPGGTAANTQMARAGLYFMLAHHGGLDWSSVGGEQQRLLRRWAQDWEPAEPRAALFEVGSDGEGSAPDTLDDHLVAFLNADSYPRQEAERDQATVLHPWLRGLVRKHGTEPDEAMLQDVSDVISELLDNVRVHGRLSSAAGLCSVAAFVTKGSAGHDLLYLSVFDTGVGMPATLAERTFPTGESDADRIAAAFNGQMHLRERDRGRGLHRITCLVDGFGGSIFAATGSAGGPTFVIDHRGRRDSAIQVQTDTHLSMTGTVVVVALPIRRRDRMLARRDQYEGHS